MLQNGNCTVMSTILSLKSVKIRFRIAAELLITAPGPDSNSDSDSEHCQRVTGTSSPDTVPVAELEHADCSPLPSRPGSPVASDRCSAFLHRFLVFYIKILSKYTSYCCALRNRSICDRNQYITNGQLRYQNLLSGI